MLIQILTDIPRIYILPDFKGVERFTNWKQDFESEKGKKKTCCFPESSISCLGGKNASTKKNPLTISFEPKLPRCFPTYIEMAANIFSLNFWRLSVCVTVSEVPNFLTWNLRCLCHEKNRPLWFAYRNKCGVEFSNSLSNTIGTIWLALVGTRCPK